jgi:FG-GAP-like repeat
MKGNMNTITEFVSAAFAVLILVLGAVAANGTGENSKGSIHSGMVAPTSRPSPTPRPTPGPRPTPPLTADIGSSYSNSKVPYAIDGQAILTAIGYPGQDPDAVGYGDFNRDGIPDVAFAPLSGTMAGLPIVTALGQPGGSYIDGTTQIISGEVPAPVHARKIIVADFNGDGSPDIFIADTGYDAPPFPGNHNWLLLSDGTGHLVYQSALAAIEPVGYHHSTTAGDIDHSGHIDIFVTGGPVDPNPYPYFLLNDGQGHFTVDTTRVPPGFISTSLYTCELIDVDYDGNLDLVVGGAEPPGLPGIPTEIFWGNGTGFYSDANKTVLPSDTQFDVVLDIDSEDINHDGVRDLVITRTEEFYNGFYFQVVMQTSRRLFADESLPRLIHDRPTWIGNNAPWIDWIHLVDMTGNCAPDIVVNRAARQLGWANDGNGYFTFTDGWLKVIWTTPLVGGTFSPPAPGTYSYEVNWDEPVDPASVQLTDLTLSGIQGAIVTGINVINDNFTTEFILNIPSGGNLTASIAAGAITDQSGQPNVAFSGTYPVSPWAPRSSPTPHPHPTPYSRPTPPPHITPVPPPPSPRPTPYPRP